MKRTTNLLIKWAGKSFGLFESNFLEYRFSKFALRIKISTKSVKKKFSEEVVKDLRKKT